VVCALREALASGCAVVKLPRCCCHDGMGNFNNIMEGGGVALVSLWRRSLYLLTCYG
jgi:hypothetical protein